MPLHGLMRLIARYGERVPNRSMTQDPLIFLASNWQVEGEGLVGTAKGSKRPSKAFYPF